MGWEAEREGEVRERERGEKKASFISFLHDKNPKSALYALVIKVISNTKKTTV